MEAVEEPRRLCQEPAEVGEGAGVGAGGEEGGAGGGEGGAGGGATLATWCHNALLQAAHFSKCAFPAWTQTDLCRLEKWICGNG